MPSEVYRSLMDVSFSAWRHATGESLVLGGESFSFLFDRRYTNRLNRMSRVFLEAYVLATKELAAQEDRFPSLSEIDAKMESGAVYAFKDRLMKNTEFFEEVKISGVSYLVPKARRFIDGSDTYTDLSFDFDAGTVTLPARRKTSAPAEPEPTHEVEAGEAPEGAAILPGQPEEPYEELPEEPASRLPAAEEEGEEGISQRSEAVAMEEPEGGGPPPQRWLKAAIALSALLVIFGAIAYNYYFYPPVSQASVHYSANLSNASEIPYLELDIKNPDGMTNEMELMLPANIDKSIIARGGVVTISHAGGTFVQLNSSSDANVKVYLSSNRTTLPVLLNLLIPQGFDSGLEVRGKSYDVKRKGDRIILSFDCTAEGVKFEQSYTSRR
jgi:hypothetical protein